MPDSERGMRASIELLFLSLLTFAATFGLRRAFFWDVMPVSPDQEPPRTGALEAAYLLLTVEYIAAVVAIIALAFAFTLLIKGWRARQSS
jgi:hypothetical protein